MLYPLFKTEYLQHLIILSIILTFAGSLISFKYFNKYLPYDMGREFAVNGQKSRGKPRGAGIILIPVYIITIILFVPMTPELLIYCALLAASMVSGFLDDRARKSWNEYIKGIFDLMIAVTASVVYVIYNPDSVGIQIFDRFISLPAVLFVVLMTILIWVSINVTNCSDGVDGLCGSLSITSLVTVYIIFAIDNQNQSYAHAVLLMISCILAYLWFNISPSRLLMGDAGSRAIGFFIAITVVKANVPLLYFFIAFMLLIDGGLGLVKVSLLRFLKIHIMKNIRTPLHDFVRKEKEWSDSQVVFRFTVIQILISFSVLFIYT